MGVVVQQQAESHGLVIPVYRMSPFSTCSSGVSKYNGWAIVMVDLLIAFFSLWENETGGDKLVALKEQAFQSPFLSETGSSYEKALRRALISNPGPPILVYNYIAPS